MKMKQRHIYWVLSVLAVCACAKAPSEGRNDDDKLYLESWIQVHHPDAVRTALGAYVLEEVPGTGRAVGPAADDPYVRVDYVASSLDGTVLNTSLETLSKQVGDYAFGNYYGPVIWNRGQGGLAAGVEESVSAMRIGGTRTIVLPGWLQTTERFDTAQEYLDNIYGSTPVIYEIRLRDIVTDIEKWETDSLGAYVPGAFPGKTAADSLELGFYYFRTGAPSSEEKFSADTTIYINYVGRLLNGTVFDTNVKDSAKFYGIYSASRTYAPSSVTFSKSDNSGDEDEEAEVDVTMGSSSVIPGFAKTLKQMHPHEKGAGLFCSTFGYGSSGSGKAIPAYSPLRFDIEVVDKP